MAILNNVDQKLKAGSIKSITELASMPFIQLFVSPACNLNCKYCSNPVKDRRYMISDTDFHMLESKELLDLIHNIPSTHFYLSGGEPLIHPGIKDFVIIASKCGHHISFDTNISLPLNRLRELFSAWESSHIGFVNISHHMICNISFQYIEERTRLLKEFGMRHFVKYVGVPELRSAIERNMIRWREKEVGSAVTILQGKWSGRCFPEDYTTEETVSFLRMVTLSTHGLQFFGGIRSFGLLCRGGQDFLSWNMQGKKHFIPCCHGSYFPRELSKTFFVTGDRKGIRCPIRSCLGDLMIIFGINGIADETRRLDNICRGMSEFVGFGEVIDFITGIKEKGFELVNQVKFDEVIKWHKQTPSTMTRFRSKLRGSLPIPRGFITQATSKLLSRFDLHTTPRVCFPKQFQRKSGQEMIFKIEEFICQWKTPDDVIVRNPELKHILLSELKKLPPAKNDILARCLGKKVAQFHFCLPLKSNFEVASICPLRCEYCILYDLRKYRRKPLMGFEDFLSIWRYMEVFTTEIEFTGGEPLLNDDVFSMIKKTRETNVSSTLTTNAVLLNDKRIEKILEARPVNILVAYDSGEPSKYESTRRKGDVSNLKQNLGRLIQRKTELGFLYPRIILQMVVHKKNQYDIQEFFQEAREIGADEARIKPILVWPGQNKEYRKFMLDNYLIPDHPMSYHHVDDEGNLVESRKPGFCPNIQQVHIGSGSEVIPCWYILKDTFIAGYAADIPFLEIWFSSAYMEYRRRMKEETVTDGCPWCIGVYDSKLWQEHIFLKNLR